MSDAKQIESLVLFELAGATCGVRSQSVQSVERVEYVTPVPNSVQFVEGVILSRGRVIAGINLRIRLGFPRIPMDPKTRMLVIQSNGHSAGILVDSAREFVSIAVDAIARPNDCAATASGINGRYLEGIATIGNRVVPILDVEEVISGLS